MRAPHAREPADKHARRTVILAAARALFVAEDGGSLPSAARIAEAAGLAKGTVYLYFRTKEEIFAALLLAEWGELLDDVRAVFVPPDGAPPDGRGAAADGADVVAAFLARYIGHLERRPELLRLDALGYGVLEQNLGPEQLRAFKQGFVAQLARVGDAVDRRLGLPAGRGVELLTRTYALTRGLWQSLDYAEPSAAHEAASTPRAARPDLHAQLMHALAEYWRGALAGA